MTRNPSARPLGVLAATGLLLLGTATPASAAGAPALPTDLYNALRACSTDQAKPVPAWGRTGIDVRGIPQHSDPGFWRLSVQYQGWPVSQPSQVLTAEMTNASPKWEAPARLGSEDTPLLDGEIYAWQARTVERDGGAASAWTAPCYVAVDNTRPAAAPTIVSPNYPEGQVNQGGVPIEFTFGANGSGDVEGYVFTWFGSLPVSGVDIGPYGVPVWKDPYDTYPDTYVRAPSLGGPATVHLVPRSTSGFQYLTVAALDRAGNRSEPRNYEIRFQAGAPTITQVTASPQYGEMVTLDLAPDPALHAASPVESYIVEDLGPEQTTITVPATSAGTARLKFRLDDPGGDLIRVTSVSASGWQSDGRSWSSGIDTHPVVTSEVYPENGSNGGGVGVSGTFVITPKVTNVKTYTYSVNNGVEVTVKAKKGRAQFTWTPTEPGWYMFDVHGTTKSGIKTATTSYMVTVD